MFIHLHKILHFLVGAATWDGGTGGKQSTERAKRGELTDRWLGPYTVNRNLGKGVYELKSSSGKALKNKYNITQLKVIHLITHY